MNENDSDVPMEEAQVTEKSAIDDAWEEDGQPGESEIDEDGEHKLDPHADSDDDSAIGREDEEDFGDPERNSAKYLAKLKTGVRVYLFALKSSTHHPTGTYLYETR